MRIEKIKVVNFGPFYGEHQIEFPDEGIGVQLIRGNTGQGKTSIQRAILWSLYGKVVDRKGQEIRPTSLLNMTARNKDIYQFGVVVHFNHEKSEWTISRKMEAHAHLDAKYQQGMSVSVVKDGEPEPNPEHVIQRIIPHDVSRFFFFDGEMLRDYEELLDQSSHSMALLRDSIEHVLGIPYLRIARDDLLEVQRKMESERSKLIRRLGGKEYDDLVDDFQKVSDEIDLRNKTIKQLKKQWDGLDVEIAEKKRRLVDIKSVQKLAEDRIQLEKNIELLETKREQLEEKNRELTSQLYKTILARTADDIIEQLRAKHEASMAKYNEKQKKIGLASQLEQAISAQKCRLCGTVLNPDKMRNLKSDLKDVEIQIEKLTEIPEPNLEFENHMNRLSRMRSQMTKREKFKEIEAAIFKLDHEISTERAKLSKVKERLAKVDEDEPRRLEQEIEDMSKEQGRLEALKSKENESILDLLKFKAELDQRIASIDKKELGVLAKRIDMAKNMAHVLEAAITIYRDERRTDVESSATEIFREIRTKESFERLKINEQFGLNIITSDGAVLDRAEWRSSGEEQIVALALVGALNRCARIEAPVFMDTPLGRLDVKHGKRVLTFLPKLAEQVVLLVTDREFRKGDEQYLDGKIVSDYTVTYKGEKEGSFLAKTIDAGAS